MTDSDVRLEVYREIARTGRAPLSAALAGQMGVPVGEIREALERLATGRVLALQPHSREILFAAPFSAIPTPHVVHAAGCDFFAPCIWDAFGAIAVLHGDGSVETSCPCCGEALSVELRAGRPAPLDAVVHFALPAKQWWDDIAFT